MKKDNKLFVTYIVAGLSAAIATAGSRWIFAGLPWTCKNWAGSCF